MADDSIPRTLLEVDVFIVSLKTWQDIENIPNRYADLSQFFDEIQSRSNSGALLFDFSVNDTGVHKPKRIIFISLSDVAAWYGLDECTVAFISRQHSGCQRTKTFNLPRLFSTHLAMRLSQMLCRLRSSGSVTVPA